MDLTALEVQLDYRFEHPALLRQALTHPSVAHEQGALQPHNQRLEFLGDAVLQLVLTEELYRSFPTNGEGPLTKARAQMVNRRSLADVARRLELGRFLTLGRGEELHGGRQRSSSLADALEALIGAVYLDGGLAPAQRLVLRLLRPALGQFDRLPDQDNPKGELQEWLQSASADPPHYQLTAVSGPDHDRMFECAVFHGGQELGRGRGKSKKEAESRAAIAALRLQEVSPRGPASTPEDSADPGLDTSG
jgi:ribonuclease-3